MQFSMNTYYRLEFLPLVVSFVTAIARCFGADQKEEHALNIASEEACMHIISRYPGNGLEEQLEVVCEALEDGLRVTFHNLGLPINLLELPKYDAGKPEDTVDGLGLFLMENLVDHHEFVNQGRNGWRTVIFKRLDHMKAPQRGEDAWKKSAIENKEILRFLQAGVEHVPGIVELVYRSYGYSYSKDVFYYPDQLRDAITGGYIRSIIALNPEGRVVGHMGVRCPQDGRDIVEICVMVVQPEYRRSNSAHQLFNLANQKILLSPGFATLAVTDLVTAHIATQKMASCYHFFPTALKLSVHGRARFAALSEDTKEQRESLLYAIYTIRPLKSLRLFIPVRHEEITRRLFAHAGIPLETPEGLSAPPSAETALTIEKNEEAAMAVVSVGGVCPNFAVVLRKLLFELESDGMKTVFVRFPGWLPHPANLEDETRKLRIFFCGWIPDSPDRWWLLYTRLNAQRFDFNTVQLFDPMAMELKLYVENCYREEAF